VGGVLGGWGIPAFFPPFSKIVEKPPPPPGGVSH